MKTPALPNIPASKVLFPKIPVWQLALLGIGVAAVALVIVAVILMQATAQNTTIEFSKLAPSSCKEGFLIQGTLKTESGKPVAGSIQLNISGRVMTLQSSSDGSFSSYYQAVQCPEEARVEAVFSGDLMNRRSSSLEWLRFAAPTAIESVGAESTNVEVGSSTSLIFSLHDAAGRAIPNASVVFKYDGTSSTAATDSAGVAHIILPITTAGLHDVTVEFNGTGLYSPSRYKTVVNALIPKCSEGTEVGHCSTSDRGYKCAEGKNLQFDCKTCGCPGNQVCWQNSACITQAEADSRMISVLKKQVVEIQGEFCTGSGVAYTLGTEDVILTNRHVAECLYPLPQARIYDYDGNSARVRRIQVAKNDYDFAVVFYDGRLDVTSAEMQDIPGDLKGRTVVAIGNPRGLTNSVSRGIVSAVRDTEDDCYGISSSCIQTDATINHGNSGGGLFDFETGSLIGITTLGSNVQYAVNLNFAIDINSIDLRPSSVQNWADFNPPILCEDGTPLNTCSESTTGSACVDGQLVPYCSVCGCPSDYPYCDTDGTCFSCRNGGTAYRTSSGQYFCCSPGYGPYETSGGTGFCCPPGYGPYEVNGNGFCCPPGSVGQTDGSCA